MCKLNKLFWAYARIFHYVWTKKKQEIIKQFSPSHIFTFTFICVGLFPSRHFIITFHIQHTYTTLYHIFIFFNLFLHFDGRVEYTRKCLYANWQYHALNDDYVFILWISFEHMLKSTESKLLHLLVNERIRTFNNKELVKMMDRYRACNVWFKIFWYLLLINKLKLILCESSPL